MKKLFYTLEGTEYEINISDKTPHIGKKEQIYFPYSAESVLLKIILDRIEKLETFYAVKGSLDLLEKEDQKRVKK